jgi:hypothetical protein
VVTHASCPQFDGPKAAYLFRAPMGKSYWKLTADTKVVLGAYRFTTAGGLARTSCKADRMAWRVCTFDGIEELHKPWAVGRERFVVTHEVSGAFERPTEKCDWAALLDHTSNRQSWAAIASPMAFGHCCPP